MQIWEYTLDGWRYSREANRNRVRWGARPYRVILYLRPV